MIFGGTTISAEDQPVVLDELLVLDIECHNELTCTVNPNNISGPRPAARSGATLLEFAPGQLLLYGGVGADGKPLNDAFLLDVETLHWQQLYNGSPELVGPQGDSTDWLAGAVTQCVCASACAYDCSASMATHLLCVLCSELRYLGCLLGVSNDAGGLCFRRFGCPYGQ